MSRSPAKKKHNQPQADSRKSVRNSSSAKITGARFVFVAGVVFLGFGIWRFQVQAPSIDDTSQLVKADKSQVSPESMIAADPPRPASMIGIDPLLIGAIHERLDRVTKNRNDPDAWGQLGILYEANGYRNLAIECYAKAFDLDRTRPRWRFHWGLRKKESGEFSEANTAFQDVLSLRPNHAPTYEQIGKIALHQMELDQAEVACKKVIELRPNEAGSYVGLAEAYIAAENYEKALPLLDRALRLNPRSRMPYFLRGQTYRALGRVEEAAVDLRRGAGSIPIHVKNPWQEEVFNSMVSGRGILQQAARQIDAGLIDSGIALLEQLQLQIPEDTEVVLLLAKTYLTVNRFDDARQVLTNLISQGTDDSKLRIQLSLTYIKLNEPMMALREARKAVDLAPDDSRVYLNLGNAHATSGRTSEALEAYLRSSELDSSYPEVHASIGRTLANLKRFREAIPHYERAIRLEPRWWRPMFALGMLYAQTGQIEKAEEYLERALSLQPGQPQIQKVLKRIRSNSGNR